MFASLIPGKLRKAPTTDDAAAKPSLNTHFGAGSLATDQKDTHKF